MAAARASKVCPQARIPRDIDALTKPKLLAAIASAGVGRENERIAQLYYVERLPQVDVAAEILLGRGYKISGSDMKESPITQKLRTLGADAVGMSTACECIAARHMGLRVAGISCISNLAAGISAAPLSHAEVQETAARVGRDFERLLCAVVRAL